MILCLDDLKFCRPLQLFNVDAHYTALTVFVLCAAGTMETRMVKLGSWREATTLQACRLIALWALGSWSPRYLRSRAWCWINKVKLGGVSLQASHGGGSDSGGSCHRWMTSLLIVKQALEPLYPVIVFPSSCVNRKTETHVQ